MDSTYPLCTIIKSDGARCGSPALKGMNLCFQHIGGNISALTRARATSGANTKLKFAYPGDREAIQHNLFLVAQALGDGKIDNATANTYNRLFRTCHLNLRQWETARQGVTERMLPLADETSESAEQQSPDINQETPDQDSTIPDRYPEPCTLNPEPCPPAAPQADAANSASANPATANPAIEDPHENPDHNLDSNPFTPALSGSGPLTSADFRRLNAQCEARPLS
jgi:hypothetical protein